MRRVMWMVACVLALSIVPATAAGAAEAQPGAKDDSLVVLNGNATVAEGDTVDSVVVFNGSATVDGSVTGSVVVFSGPAAVSGDVGGDVIVFDGTLALKSGAHVHGSVYADTRVIATDAKVDGDVQTTAKFAVAAGWGGVALWIGTMLVIAISLLLFGLIFLWFAPRAADAAVVAGRTAVGASIGWGALLLFALPIVAVLLMVTVFALPIGFVLLFGLGLIYALGMVAGSLFLGRMMVKTGSRAGAFALGWLIVTIASLIPGLGSLVWLVVTGYGLGILCVAAYRAGRKPEAPIEVPPVPEVPVSA